MTAVRYSYVFGSVRTGAVLEDIGLYGVSFDNILNAGGNFQGSYNLDQTGKSNASLVDATDVGKRFVVVERDEVPVWGGFITTRTYQQQAKVVSLTAKTYDAYPSHRFIRQGTFFTNVDKREIFRQLWIQMQSDAGSNIHVEVPATVFSGGPTATISVDTWSFKKYSTVMNDLADGDDGFDWTIDVVKQEGSSSAYRWILRIGYPKLGAISSPDSLVFAYPGSIISYYETESLAGVSGTNIFLIGAGEGSDMLYTEGEWPELVDVEDWPRFDLALPYKGVTDMNILLALTQQEAQMRKPPKPFFNVTLKANLDPEFGSYGLGDAATLDIRDPKHPSGLRYSTRVIGYNLHPSSSSHVEEVELVLEGESSGQV